MLQPSSLRTQYRRFAQIAGLIVALAGVAVLTGWLTSTWILTSFLPGQLTVKFNAGICLILSGTALCLLAARPSGKFAVWAIQVAALLTALIGVLTVAEYATGSDFGIDQLFVKEQQSQSTLSPGRMSAVAALIFTLVGSALFVATRNARSNWTDALVLFAMCNALIPAIGYLYGRSALYETPYFGTVALPSTLLSILLCAGLLAARPDRGLMALITNRSAGGITARMLLPSAILIPIVIDRIQFWGQEAGLFDATFGLVLYTLSTMALFTALILWNARLLLQIDMQRDRAEHDVQQALDKLKSNIEALSRSNRQLQEEIIERSAAEERLVHQHERMNVTLRSISDGVITTDADGRITYLNPAAEKMSGWAAAEATGEPINSVFTLVDPVSREAVTTPIDIALHENKPSHLPSNCVLIHRDGSESAVDDSCAPMHDGDGKVIGAVLVFRDVSALRTMTQRMTYLAQHDFLTDLPNRVLLNERLSHAIALAMRHGTRTALMFLDIDRFKHVNDTLGHLVGDHLLQEIARRLKACMRETDTISRQGGDEFIILLHEVSDTIGAARAAHQLLTAISAPYFIDGHELHISGSIGISICPEDGEDSETIIKHADAAMYQAKAQGRNNYQFFARHINERAVERFALEGSLRKAIAREESILYFQPKLDIATGRLTGAEALLRWHSADNTVLLPAQFIAIAEESGLIVQMGEWVLREACRQNRAWQDAGYPPIPISVNVSAVQFKDKNFLQLVSRVLHETRLEPRYLELELTESVTMQEMEVTIALLEGLKAIGVSLSIDDFGTGYSSLSYLKRFPIDTIKIDKSFVQDIVGDPDSAAIICTIISMAKILKQKVIAEGVETVEQFRFLQQQECDEIQGYYFSPPLPGDQFENQILQRIGVRPLPMRSEVRHGTRTH
jgi:diguanylate cyclase (GGDEF)-like protein/PAS domain S-box-containing protein